MIFTPPQVGPALFSDAFYAALSAFVRFMETTNTLIDAIYTLIFGES